MLRQFTKMQFFSQKFIVLSNKNNGIRPKFIASYLGALSQIQYQHNLYLFRMSNIFHGVAKQFTMKLNIEIK